MDAATDTEAWLAQNTGWCERLKARVTPQQCRENRKRARMMGEMEPGLKPCINCQGITPGQTMPKAKKKEGKGKMTKIYCQICKEPKANAGRGLCARHYMQAKNDGTLEQYRLEDATFVEDATKPAVAVGDTEPDPESQSEPNLEAAPEPQEENTQESDPLEGAERITTTKPPQAKLRKSKNSIDFNISAMRKFQMHLYSYADFHLKNGRLFMHMHGKPDENSMKIGWKDHQASSSVTVSFHAIARKLELTAPMYFNVLGTSREDVLELERV